MCLSRLRRQNVLPIVPRGAWIRPFSCVKGLVESHGGSVTAESEGIGAGAKFTVTLPRYSELLSSKSPKGETSVSPPAEKIRIMIVDDNKDAAVLMSMLLDLQDLILSSSMTLIALERARIERPTSACLTLACLAWMETSSRAVLGQLRAQSYSLLCPNWIRPRNQPRKRIGSGLRSLFREAR